MSNFGVMPVGSVREMGKLRRGPAQETRVIDRRMVGVVAAGFCVFLSVYAPQAILPLLVSVFHATAGHASLTVTATTLAIAIAAPVMGLLSERMGRKAVIVVSIFLLAAPTLLAATATNLNALIAWRFVQGLLMPGIIAVTLAYIAEEWPAHRVGGAMAACISANVLGGVVGRMLTGWVGEHWGWNFSFLALGILDLIGGVIVWKTLTPSSRKLETGRKLSATIREMGQHLHNKQLMSSYAVGFNILLILVAVFTYITFHLAAAPFNLGPAALGSLFLVYMLGVFVTPIGGRLIDRFGQRNSCLIALMITTAGILLTLAPSLAMVVVGLAICSTGIFICMSAAASYMGLVAGKSKASASGLYSMFYYVGGAAGAFIPGLFWKFGHWPLTVIFILSILGVTAIFVAKTWVHHHLPAIAATR